MGIGLLRQVPASRARRVRAAHDPSVLPFPKLIQSGGKTVARRQRRADVLAWEVACIKLGEGH